ncbi:hygromycin-B 7''-O-kinase [Streptomyces sp. B3I7]|uniref:phosphotransferase family protein n=1 Tax=Streptomyces sp. B3I7 TaxID=3042269 RepID=UPI002784998D|nr:aminoglycoside phosphotransferase family protein [Streptomyces sp. B3I7]MDQ0811939.1 hygromycin-B 7''-O-kinase [Streptomyces sp. B3I7]
MLPKVDTFDELDAVCADEKLVRAACRELVHQLGLYGAPVVHFEDGSLPVFAVGDDMVFKFYPGIQASKSSFEAVVLDHLWRQLPVETPRLITTNEYVNGWRYVMMTRLPGIDMARGWHRIPPADKDRLISEAGEVLAALHKMDITPLKGALPPLDWEDFVAQRRVEAMKLHSSKPVPRVWLEQIPDFLNSVRLPVTDERVLLHTEFMREHLTVAPRENWRLTGLFDFETALIGDPAYDFASVGAFVTYGQPRQMRRFFRAYGRDPFDPDQMLAYLLLHLYCDLPFYFSELPTPAEPRLDILAETWFGTNG